MKLWRRRFPEYFEGWGLYDGPDKLMTKIQLKEYNRQKRRKLIERVITIIK